MKTGIFSAFILMVLLSAVAGCRPNDGQGREVTGYREIELTVASEKIPGVVGIGNNSLMELYAVKTAGSREWTSMSAIGGFEYEEGTEYRIRISETDYLDHSMGTPSWTERELLEIISESDKESEGLPDHFIPEWFIEGRFVPEYRYAIEATDKAGTDKFFKDNNPFPEDGKCLLYGAGLTKWMMLDASGDIIAKGVISRKDKESSDFPDVYKILPPEGGQVYAYMEWTFLDEKGEKEMWPPFDVLIAEASSGRSFSPFSGGNRSDVPQTKEAPLRTWTPYLYIDLTDDCRAQFPESGVTAAVASLELELPI